MCKISGRSLCSSEQSYLKVGFDSSADSAKDIPQNNPLKEATECRTEVKEDDEAKNSCPARPLQL